MEDNYKKVPLLDKHNKNEVDKIIKEYNNFKIVHILYMTFLSINS